MNCPDGRACIESVRHCTRADLPGMCAAARSDSRYALAMPAPPCRHRSARFACGEVVTLCALGLGQLGIVDPADCLDCTRAVH